MQRILPSFWVQKEKGGARYFGVFASLIRRADDDEVMTNGCSSQSSSADSRVSGMQSSLHSSTVSFTIRMTT